MRLTSFTVTRFRSISQSATVPIAAGVTTLVGPNNEGKSNILTALGIALEVLTNVPSDSRHPLAGRVVSRQPTSFSFVLGALSALAAAYNWERDYPISLRDSSKPRPTRFELELELDSEEITQFRKAVGSSIDGRLPIALTVNREHVWTFSVPKKGRGSHLSSKAPEIARFVGSKVGLQYVPAVRTAEEAQQTVVRHLLRRLISEEALDKLCEAIRDILDQDGGLTSAETQICEALRPFVPAKSARFQVNREALIPALGRVLELRVDDGVMTPLSMKGDGVVSLVSVGLARQFGNRGRAQALVLAIEEPESHLHPEKACQLRAVLQELTSSYQVIVTTHNPSLVQRGDIGSNIIVRNGEARPAKSLKEIRDALGVTLSHNLTSAELMLLVEGETDAIILEAALKEISPKIRKAIEQGTFAVDPVGGASKLAYRLSLASRADLYNYLVVLDDDIEGRQAYEDAKGRKLLEDSEITFLARPGSTETELEDLLNEDCYRDVLQEYFGGVDVLAHKKFRAKKKWTVRLGDAAKCLGRSWNADVENDIKHLVARHVSARGLKGFNGLGVSVITALATSAEHRMDELGL